MANMMHETANFVYLREIASGWAYEGREDLGNIHPGDGPRFKGAGVLQLTGRYNYEQLFKDIGDKRIMEGCTYVAETYPFRSAKRWIEDNDLLSVCLHQGFEACCKRVNGGYNGLKDRKIKYAICQREIN
jgi:putative chitinase